MEYFVLRYKELKYEIVNGNISIVGVSKSQINNLEIPEYRNWDPTDPSSKNPWKKFFENTEKITGFN